MAPLLGRRDKMFYLLQLSLLVLQVHSLPSGAPAEACNYVYPGGHGGTSQDIRDNPFSLNMTEFDELGGTLYYVPETINEIILSGNGALFRGYLVQARALADESPAGSFIASGANQRLSSCPIPESAVTHSTATDKTETIMTWKAPPNGTGRIQFVFAVVQRYSPSEGINMFWATAATSTLHPCEFPVYMNEGQCVQTCPPDRFGNHETQQCEIYPESFTVSTNATEYYTSFTSDVNVGTAVINFSVVLNHTYWDTPVESVYVGFVGDSTTLDIFGLTSDGEDTQNILSVSLSEANRTVDFSIYYSMTPLDTVAYPFDFNLTMTVIVVGLASGTIQIENTDGFVKGRINPQPDPCSSTPCVNGNCTTTTNQSFTCSCTIGYTGSMCEVNIDECIPYNHCLNGGTCVDLINEYKCICPLQCTGSECNETVAGSPCDCSPCENGGSCVEFPTNITCICPNGFGGVRCEIDLDFCEPERCLNGGTCIEGVATATSCNCPSQFTGDSCMNNSQINPSCTCMNGGSCSDDDDSGIIGSSIGLATICNCPNGFTGVLCETNISNSGENCTVDRCSSNGICMEVDGYTTCICALGFTGDSCEIIDLEFICQEDSCENGGTCNVEHGNTFSCTCAFEFTGNICETKLQVCMESVCRNGGTCFESGGQEVCSCLPKFTGAQCESELCLAEDDVPVYPGSSITYNWSQTAAGKSEKQMCPDICQDFIDYPPRAAVVRECLTDTAEWQDTDVTGCGFSATALQLCEAKQLMSNTDLASAVVNITADVSSLEPSAIIVSGDIILDLTDAAIEEPEVRDNYLSAIDNILGANMDDLLTSQRQSNSSTKILQGLNRFLDLVPVNNETGNVTFTLNNFGLIALGLSSINESEIQQTFSANLGPVTNAVSSRETIAVEQLFITSEPISNTTGSITPQGLDSCLLDNGSQRIAYSVFRTAALFLTPETACEQFSIGSIILGVRTTIDAKSCNTTSVIVDMQQLTEVCRVMLASNSTFSAHVDGVSGMQLSSDQQSICSNYANSGGGRWSSESCRKIKQSGGRTTCDCSQLGHFGLLFDLNPGESLSPLALAIISYIGTILSIMCLVIVILTYLSSKELRKSEHGGLLINLSVSLICLYVVFVIAGLVTSVKVLCGLVSALFQYFMLVYFGWTAAEAVILYYRLVKVLGKPIEHYVTKAALFVWLVPLLIVTASVGPGHKYYINSYYCRVTEWPFWFGLILPFCTIYAFNWIVFTLIMVRLLHRSTTLLKHDVKSKTAAKNIKQNLIITIGLSILFGLGWGFGFTATSSDKKEVTFAFQVLFSLFVGSQGVLIFIFHGVRSAQFRQIWLSFFSLRNRKKVFSLSSQHPMKQSGPNTSYNVATLTATGALPSDSCSKFECNAQKLSSFEASEAGVSTFVTSKVISNQNCEIFAETS